MKLIFVSFLLIGCSTVIETTSTANNLYLIQTNLVSYTVGSQAAVVLPAVLDKIKYYVTGESTPFDPD